MLQLKEYQQRSLDALSEYFKDACRNGARMAFMSQTDRPYKTVPSLAEMPYICLRVPTGGGKTVMASYALGITSRDYLQDERAVCLWLVPSNTIRDQTLAALRNREHPYRQALDAHFAGNVSVMDLKEALYVQRGTLDGDTVVIVSTLAALRVEDTDGRKVYETAGALMHHFSSLTPDLRSVLETEGDGQVIYSLANVLRLRRPVVIMDEAHNARTRLSFDTLIRFNPSCVIEFTATPVTIHDPEKGLFASNVLHHVSAAELKEAEMIKLPIKLRTRSDWKEVIADALQQRHELEQIAREEQRTSNEYIRPIILFQAQPHNKDRQTHTVDVVKQTLIDDFRVSANEIAIATGETREIDDIDLFSPSCPIRYIITVQALKEGWDCSFAYILCSIAEQYSARSVEQLLGRVLRMPHAVRKGREELNCAYAFAASNSFVDTAASLHDGLVENGFQRLEARDLVTAMDPEESGLFRDNELNLFTQISELLIEQPDFESLPSSITQHVTYDPASKLLIVQGGISESEVVELQERTGNNYDKDAIKRIYHRFQGRSLTPVRTKPEPFDVPALSLFVDGVSEYFDDSYFLDIAWNLSACSAILSEGEFSSELKAGELREIDISQSGRLEITFIDQLHDQLIQIASEQGWTLASLVNWLDRQIRHIDITQTQSSLFIYRVVTDLIENRGIPLERLARLKYRLMNAIDRKISTYREDHRKSVYQQTLFGPDKIALQVVNECSFAYDTNSYSPGSSYEGAYRFAKHYTANVGELRPDGEEFECACLIDQIQEVKFWVRNLERRPNSFWLQTSTDKFYPDFVAELVDGRKLVVEYKGEDRWSNDDSKEKRAIGELWAERSGGQCLFVMPKGKDFAAIINTVKSKS